MINILIRTDRQNTWTW